MDAERWSPKHGDLLQDGPPYHPLLNDPISVLLDRKRWPDHLCYEVASESTGQWFRSRFRQSIYLAHRDLCDRDVYESLQQTVPIPVGIMALQTELCQLQSLFHTNPFDALWPLMPFAGEEYAFLILTARISGSVIEFYGLVTRYVDLTPPPGIPLDGITGPMDTRPIVWFSIASCMFRISGDNPSDPSVQRFIRAAQHWWKRLEGQPLRGSENAGRPRGLRYSAEEIRDAFNKWRQQFVRNPTQEQLSEILCISPQYLRIHLRRYNLRWPRSIDAPL